MKAAASVQSRRRAGLRWGVIGLLLLLSSVAQAQLQAAASSWARFPAQAEAAQVNAQLARFQPLAEQDVLTAAAGEVIWLRWRRPADPQQHWLVAERDLLARVDAFSAAEAQPLGATQGFFTPLSGQWLATRYSFDAGGGEQDLLLRIEPLVDLPTRWQWMSEGELLRSERVRSVVAAASYSALLATLLASLALTLAVRQAVFPFFTLWVGLLAGFLAAADGFLFELPLLDQLGNGLGARLLLLLAAACCASALAFSHRLLGLAAQSPPLSRWTDRLAWAALALGGLALLLPLDLMAVTLSLLVLLLGAAALLPLAIAAWSWSLGSLFASVLCLLWAGFLAVLGTRLALLAGWVPMSDALRSFCQLGGAATAMGLSVALTERVIALRRQVELIQRQHAESAASLELEQRRRQFAGELRELAAHPLPPGDLEWKAFRLLMQALAELIAARNIGLSATGYRGFDYLLAEPISGKARLCTLLADRSSTLKGICRARSPVQLPFDVADPGRDNARGHFAVIPLAIPRPGWGALLIERESGIEFAAGELALAVEFGNLTLQVIEDSALKDDLRRHVEFDPLTALLNRRAGESRLESLLAAARETGSALSLLFVDFDQFRALNERYGVALGDQCLRSAADAIRPLCGARDVLLRFAGDELVIALPEADAEAALALAERVRGAVAALRVKSDATVVKVTVSVGVAPFDPAQDDLSRLLDRAQRAAGQAKGKGRNQVVLVAEAMSRGEAPKLLGF